MVRPLPIYCLLAALCFLPLVANKAFAVRPGEQLLPATTKGFLSIPDMDQLREKWDSTQLGQMVNDPVMRPFVDDLRRQVKTKLTQLRERIGFELEDLEGVPGGEVNLALIQPAGRTDAHALAILVDVTGRQVQARGFLDKVIRSWRTKGAAKRILRHEGVELITFVVTSDIGQTHQPCYVLHHGQLIASDDLRIAQDIVARMAGKRSDSLATHAGFRGAMGRCQQFSGQIQPHLRWFVEPFGYIQVVRAAARGKNKRGTDLLNVLANQGFTAVQGIGGHISLATGEHELLHRTFVCAPAVESSEDGHKYRLAARMLDFPNGASLEPPSWVPPHAANYLTFQWKMKEAFEYAKSLANEFAGEEVFEEILKNIKEDPNGPQVDIRHDLVAHFGERATLVTDYQLPITPKSERFLFAIELTDAAAVSETINKTLAADPDAKKHVLNGHVIWEMGVKQEEEAEEETELITIEFEGPGFGFGPEEEVEPEEEPLLTTSAITVAEGRLIVAANVDFVSELLQRRADQNQLAQAADFRLINEQLEKLGGGYDSFRFFSRTDEAYRPTYELVRQGRVAESESLLAKLLRRLLGREDGGVAEPQAIDGSKMPEFDLVRRYLGPAGFYVQSQEDGWYVCGCLLPQRQ